LLRRSSVQQTPESAEGWILGTSPRMTLEVVATVQ
jgi:hypothetical protein